MGCLYKVTNTRNGKCYVGITTRTAKERWRAHVYDAQRGSDNLLHRAIRKHGPDAFTVRVLARSDDWKQLCQLEQHYIAKLKTHWRHGGYNCTAGGDGIVDMPEESRARQTAHSSETMKRQNADPEFAARRDARTRRMWTDDEFRAKMKTTMKRLWADDEFRAKMIEVSSKVGQTTIKRLLAAGWRGERTAFTEFCREHGLKGRYVRKRLRQRGLYGLKDINHPIVREVLEEMIAERRTDTVPAKKPHAGEGAGLTLH